MFLEWKLWRGGDGKCKKRGEGSLARWRPWPWVGSQEGPGIGVGAGNFVDEVTES